MTTPPELPEEPNPFEPPAPHDGPIPPPPPPPATSPTLRYSAGDPRRYDNRLVVRTAVITVAVIAVATYLVPFVGLLVPLILFVSLFFLLAKDPTVRYRSVLSGLLIGLGLGLIVTAGLCSAIFSGNLPTPLFPSS